MLNLDSQLNQKFQRARSFLGAPSMFLATNFGWTLKKSPKNPKGGKGIALVQNEMAAPSNLAAIREQIANRVAARALELVDSAMDAAQGGQFVAMKYLFEGVGLFPVVQPTADNNPDRDVLARTLLHHLGLFSAPAPGSAVTEESES
jgi:hypothetical protein